LQSTTKNALVVFMSKSSRKFHVPDALAHLYDFANTADLRRFVHNGIQHQAADELGSPRDLASWMKLNGLVAHGGNVTMKAFDAAIELRASIRAFLAKEPAERRLDREIVARLNRAVQPFPLTVRASANNGMVLESARSDALGSLSPVVAQLYDASANSTLGRLKICASEECQRVFYDRSKPGTRRWCQAALCGNRMKTRAYRERKKQAAPSGRSP
jgi:predicted RNA-binding Zn ribbon-like protein